MPSGPENRTTGTKRADGFLTNRSIRTFRVELLTALSPLWFLPFVQEIVHVR